MKVLRRLRLVSTVEEAGGPSEYTFYKVFDDSQRKEYIRNHPNSKFNKKQSEENKNPQKVSAPSKTPDSKIKKENPEDKKYQEDFASGLLESGYNNKDDFFDEDFGVNFQDEFGEDISKEDFDSLMNGKISFKDYLTQRNIEQPEDNTLENQLEGARLAFGYKKPESGSYMYWRKRYQGYNRREMESDLWNTLNDLGESYGGKGMKDASARDLIRHPKVEEYLKYVGVPKEEIKKILPEWERRIKAVQDAYFGD